MRQDKTDDRKISRSPNKFEITLDESVSKSEIKLPSLEVVSACLPVKLSNVVDETRCLLKTVLKSPVH
jgi:hypothetical protein